MKTVIFPFHKHYALLAKNIADLNFLQPVQFVEGWKNSQKNLQKKWETDVVLIFIGSLGIATRLTAPFLKNKRTDPGIIVIDGAANFCIVVNGGHSRSMNTLCRLIAEQLQLIPVITTGTEACGYLSPEEIAERLDCQIEDPHYLLKTIQSRLIEGEIIPFCFDESFSPPYFPGYQIQSSHHQFPQEPFLYLTDRISFCPKAVFVRPRSLVIGTGFRKQFSIEIFEEFYHDFIEKNKYSHLSVAEVLTLDRKVPSLLPLVQSKSIKITGYSPDQLKNVTGDFHSPCAQKHLKIPGLSEPSLIIRGAEILVGKTVYPDMTFALGRLPWKPQGSLTFIGIGPGQPNLMTIQAIQALEESDLIIGYETYLKMVPFRYQKRILSICTKMGEEIQRVKKAIELVKKGNRVAVISSGDSGVFGMTAPGVELAIQENIPWRIVPGITAALWGASLIGSPLVNGFCIISLSDYLIGWDSIITNLQLLAQTELPIVVYNLVKKDRSQKIEELVDIVQQNRGLETNVAIIKKDGTKEFVQLQQLIHSNLDMNTLLIIGGLRNKRLGEYLITDRGYTL
jgi:cobalt-precorrin 5A hydrolase/precorrin-3B C17-methyltransferase